MLIKNHGKIVGGVRVVNKGDRCYRVSPIFIQPLEQGKGIAQKLLRYWRIIITMPESGS